MEDAHPRQQHNAYFIAPFKFSDAHLAEFKRRRFADGLVKALANDLSGLTSSYATNPPSPREEKRRLRATGNALKECSDALAVMDDRTASVLDMRARPLGADLKFRELRKEIALFCEAAEKAVEKIKVPETGPDATKAIAIARCIGRTLQRFNMPLSDKAAGPFVIATTIVFEELGISKANPRNDVKRAMETFEKFA